LCHCILTALRLQEELEVYLDDLPVCVEKDRCLDEPEFFLWALKLAETIEQVLCIGCSLGAGVWLGVLGPLRSSAHVRE
jgi:hypothetical protein